jgi:ABC-type multidrug transport system fused ATPase/permease subunit
MKKREILKLYFRMLSFHQWERGLIYLVSVLAAGFGFYALCAAQGQLLSGVMQLAEGAPSETVFGRMLWVALSMVPSVAVFCAGLVGTTYAESGTGRMLRRELLARRSGAEEQAARKIGDSDVFTRLNEDMDLCLETIGWRMNGQFFNPILSGLFSLGAISAIDWRMGAFCLIAAIFTCLPLNAILRRTRALQGEMQREKAGIAREYSDMLGGAEEIRVFQLLEWVKRRFGIRSYRLYQRQNQYNGWRFFRGEWFELGYYFNMIGLLAIGGLLAGRGEMAFSAVVVSVPLCGQVMQMVQGFGGMWSMIAERSVCIQRVTETLDAPQEELGQDVASENRPQEIMFSNVSFGYEPGQTVLNQLSFRVEPGQSAAFVGESGCGKSTLLRLLMGLYQPWEGQISIGDRRQEQTGLSAWRRQIAYIGQESALFDLTVGENIALAQGGAMERSVMEQAARQAGAAEFIEELAQSYDSPVGEGGRNLSGGQRQRIAVARGLAARAGALLMDEPTAALDSQSEEILRQTVENLRGKQTVVMISHKLAFSAGCDVIFVMDKGRIVEQGSHRQLLEKNGLYAGLWRSQTEEEPSNTMSQ